MYYIFFSVIDANNSVYESTVFVSQGQHSVLFDDFLCPFLSNKAETMGFLLTQTVERAA